MRIYDLLDDDTRKQLQAKPVVHRQKRKDKRKYSDRELKELMGVNRDRYHKVSGRVKRK